MKHCPNCFSEYEDKASTCSDCHVPLATGQPDDEQRSFAKIHRAPAKFTFGTRVLLGVLLLYTLIIVAVIISWFTESSSNRYVPGGLGLVLAWYGLYSYRKRRRAYKNYQSMLAKGFGQPPAAQDQT